jgi:hypothetical protein
MKERPILFCASMVRALLADSKMQTRSAIKYSSRTPIDYRGSGGSESSDWNDPACWGWQDGDGNEIALGAGELVDRVVTCPYGEIGDRLRVKEAAWMWCERRPNGKTPTGRDKWWYVPLRQAQVIYAADHPQKPRVGVVSPDTGNEWGWRLKIGRFLHAWPAASLCKSLVPALSAC